ncbi:MAG: hypothetical protein EBZ48_01340 [Proteobacteria bacterium]|nr:hypothetical protein [Pseudomonadota bacterium]
MPIGIGSNIASLSAQRRLNESSSTLSKTYERLSSGQRINKASDDAAGLSIASALNANARVYSQATRNGNDGLSLLSIADSALDNLTSVVTRLTELASQSANGVYSLKQRRAIDTEAQALAKEYLRIAKSTEFNGIKLLDGTLGDGLRLQLGFGVAGGINAGVGGAIGSGSFQSGTTNQTGASPGAVALADLNGDGILELVTANSGDNTVSILLGNGDGTFRASSSVATGAGPLSVTLGDLNGDGVLDIVTANYSDSSISVMLGNGDGSFKAATSMPAAFGTTAVKLGDLNGDGVLDIVASSTLGGAGNGVVSILLGNGNGTFKAATTMTVGQFPQSLALGDLNGDGILDIATADYLSNTISIMLGNGDGSFKAAMANSVRGQVRSLALGDLNGDGKLDIVAAENGISVGVMLGNGDGTFQSRSAFTLAGSPWGVTLGDLNGDGFLDIVTADRYSNSASVLLGKGDGTFGAVNSIQSGNNPLAVALGDANGDGVLDIVTANYDDSTTSVMLSKTKAGVGAMLDFSLQTKADSLQALGMFKKNA